MSEASTVVATDGPVTVERGVTVKPEGVIVEVNVRSTEEAAVEITDDLPAAVGPDQVGFHPEHTPETGEATTERVTVETPVAPDTPVTIVYGAYLDTSDLDVAWEEPALGVVAETVDEADESAEGGGLRGYVNRFFGGDEEPAAVADPESANDAAAVEELDSFETTEDGTEGTADDEADADDAAADGTEADDAVETDDAVEADDDRDDERADDDQDDERTDDQDEETPEPAIRRVGGDDDDAAAEPTDEEEDDMEDNDTAIQGGASNGTDVTEGSVAAALAAELEAGEVDPKTQDVLADELGAKLSGSQVARLDHVQKRIDNIAAYVDPLKELLDAEGRPADVVEALRDEVAEVHEETAALRDRTEDVEATTDRLDGAVDELEEATETAASEREELQAELDDVAADVETLREDVEAELDDVRETLDEELEAVRDTLDEELDRVEQAAREGRRDIEADVADLQAVASQVEALREALSTAFGTEPAATEPTEATDGTEDEDAEEREPSADDGAGAGDTVEEPATEQATDGGNDIERRLREMEADDEPEREEPF